MEELKGIQSLADQLVSDDDSLSKKTKRLRFEAGVSEILDSAGMEFKEAGYNTHDTKRIELRIVVKGRDRKNEKSAEPKPISIPDREMEF